MTQADLVRATGLSAAAVSGLVHELVEHSEVAIRTGVANGRRGRLVELIPSRRVGAGVDIGRTHLRVVLGAGPRTLIANRCVDLPPRHDPAQTLPAMRRAIEEACRRAGTPVEELDGIGLSIPGPVDARTGTVVGGAILCAYDGAALRELVATELDREPAVGNDANMGPSRWTPSWARSWGWPTSRSGIGIGAGIVVDGRPLLGSTGTIGEIGHLSLDPALAVICRCGRRGCLETRSSMDAIRSSLGAALGAGESLAPRSS